MMFYSSCIRVVFALRSIRNLNNVSTSFCKTRAQRDILLRSLSTSPVKLDLMEFFEDEKNWGKDEIRVGRSWKVDELRLKSNEDLHKLWYVLLKERNMLMTMEHEAKVQWRVFPNPERLDKVAESMANLESVVKERNRAYYELETGETGERPKRIERNEFGQWEERELDEHAEPEPNRLDPASRDRAHEGEFEWFLDALAEQEKDKEIKESKKRRSYVMQVLRTFPDTNLKLLQEAYPEVDIMKLIKKDHKAIRGHFNPDERVIPEEFK